MIGEEKSNVVVGPSPRIRLELRVQSDFHFEGFDAPQVLEGLVSDVGAVTHIKDFDAAKVLERRVGNASAIGYVEGG